MSSCYHEVFGGKGGGGGGGSTTAKVSFVMVADTPPASLGLISFKVVPTSIAFTTATGTQTVSINGGSGFAFDLVRLQSDSAFLGTAASVPTGTISSVAVTFSGGELAFFNGTGTNLTNPSCLSQAVCIATFAGPFTATATGSQTISANGGLGIDIDLSNVLSVSGTTLSLAFTATNAASSFTLPRQNANLASGQLDIIEDLTGIVTVNGTSATITPAPIVGRPATTAATATGTNFDPDPTNSACVGAATLVACVANDQAASMDAILNSDGTFTVREIEPLLTTVVDTVEGTVVSINANQTQFQMVVTDIIPAASSSKIGSVTLGSALTVNLSATPTFLVDTKGLAIGAAGSDFTTTTTTSSLRPGQSVAVHVVTFTAANGTTIASATTDTVTLRWSRFIATPTGAASPSLFNLTSLPSYFQVTASSILPVQIFDGTAGADGITNLDGIASGSAPSTGSPIGIRALYIENSTNTETPAPLLAAKVRQQ